MNHNTFSRVLVASLSSFLFPALVSGATIRVDHESTTNGPGTSTWSNAYDNIQDALDNAEIGDDIWIADGTYKPTVRTDPNDARSVTFSMLSGVILYGGFQGLSRPGGGETSLAQRNPLHETILSGDIGTASDPSDNAYHVVTAEDVDSTSRLNGFTIRDGYADGDDDKGVGAGMWIKVDASPLVIRCRFTSNHATAAGGAAEIDGPEDAGSVYTEFLACTFDNNNSDLKGGGLSMKGVPLVRFANCLAYDNESGESGGAFLFADCAGVEILNCTVTRNYTDSENLGAMHFAIELGCGHMILTNCVIYGNTNLNGSAESAQISFNDVEEVTVSHCDVQGLDYFSGRDNIDVDPLFVDGGNDDFRLQYFSLLLNNGDAGEVPADTYDIDDDSDTSELLPDRTMADRNINPIDCVDMGAFEEQTAGTCLGDITDAYGGAPDGEVDDSDLDRVMEAWGTPGGVADMAPSPCGNGVVNTGDMLAVLNNWGSCNSLAPGGNLPEWLQDCVTNCGEDSECLVECIVEHFGG